MVGRRDLGTFFAGKLFGEKFMNFGMYMYMPLLVHTLTYTQNAYIEKNMQLVCGEINIFPALLSAINLNLVHPLFL